MDLNDDEKAKLAEAKKLRLKPADVPVDRRAAARALFEGVPNMTPQKVAAEVGVTPQIVNGWKRQDGWVPAAKRLPDLSARAGVLANSFKRKISEMGQALAETTGTNEVAKEVADEFAVDVRGKVIQRQQTEWAAPRKVAYEAITKSQKGDVAGAFETAKLAKILSETLTLVHSGECRAYGINQKDLDGSGTVVVIERSGDNG